MKFTVTLKDPDGVDHAVRDGAKRFMEIMKETVEGLHLSSDELDEVQEQREVVLRRHIDSWFRYSEYITVEIDTELGTCTVVKP